jgi:hypothetical protein
VIARRVLLCLPLPLLVSAGCPGEGPQPSADDLALADAPRRGDSRRVDLPKKKPDSRRADGKPQPDPDLPKPAPDLAPKPDKPKPAPDLAPKDTVPSPCATGESYFGGRCYRVTGIKYISWATAKTMCAAQTPAMKMTAIGSAAENQFVYSILPPLNETAWIGLKRASPGSATFVWDSGEPFSYANWAQGEPNNEKGVEDCAIMWGPNLSFAAMKAHWNDMPCEQSKVDAVICERAP